MGVGGQGIIFLGNILRQYGLKSLSITNVVGTETRGVSQREGSVISTSRYFIGDYNQRYEENNLISPLIPINDAHLVLGLEPLETIRNLKYISENSVIILNTHKRFPKNVIIGSERNKKYPSIEKINDLLKKYARKVISLDFNQISIDNFDNPIYANTIILGAGTSQFKDIFTKDIILQILNKNLKKIDENIHAFELGYALIKE